METTDLIRKTAPLIKAEIDKATSILLHCHPSPDPDSVGSALAMKWAVEQMGKKATVIGGDSLFPDAFKHFPGANEIIMKSYGELDLSQFDLFLILDSGARSRITMKEPVVFPPTMRTVNIDHHRTNDSFADVNLVESAYPATCLMLFDLFKEWGVKLDANIAKNLFIGIYTDTGGFKYVSTTVHTFEAAAELARIAPDFPSVITDMEYTNTPGALAYRGLAVEKTEHFYNGLMAVSAVSLDELKARNIDPEDTSASTAAGLLITVTGWDLAVGLVESEPNKVKMSLRTRDPKRFDLSQLAIAAGGGGHRAAAAAFMNMPLADAKRLVVEKAKELYNL